MIGIGSIFYCEKHWHIDCNCVKIIKKRVVRPKKEKDMRDNIIIACTECKERNYNSQKNKKNNPDRIEVKKYCNTCKKHTVHKETK